MSRPVKVKSVGRPRQPTNPTPSVSPSNDQVIRLQFNRVRYVLDDNDYDDYDTINEKLDIEITASVMRNRRPTADIVKEALAHNAHRRYHSKLGK